MNFTSTPAVTNFMTRDRFINRLSMREEIDGILFMGSTASGDLKSTSDYDIVLVFNQLSVPLHILTTWIDGHFAEVHCTTTSSIQRVISQASAWSVGSEEEALIRWFRSGRIVFDPYDYLRHVQIVAQQTPPAVPDAKTIEAAWWGIGYNVAQLNRYLSMDDPEAESVSRIRLLYSVFQIVAGYFIVRGIAWPGEKVAIQHLSTHDPEYLQLLEQCIADSDVVRKAELYRELAQRALEPVGGLWPEGNTAASLGHGFGSGVSESLDGSVEENLDLVLRYWNQLILDS